MAIPIANRNSIIHSLFQISIYDTYYIPFVNGFKAFFAQKSIILYDIIGQKENGPPSLRSVSSKGV
jgi:hypothetical protein